MAALDGVAIPDDLIWVDEFEWTPVSQSEAYSLSGALIVETAVKLAGRPITLAGSQDYGWASRLTVKQLVAKAETPGYQMLLELKDGQTFSVIYRRDGAPVQAAPVVDYNAMADDDPYIIKLQLLEV